MRLALMGLTLKDQKIVGHGGNPVQWAAVRLVCRIMPWRLGFLVVLADFRE